jgi:hypothetical protein
MQRMALLDVKNITKDGIDRTSWGKSLETVHVSGKRGSGISAHHIRPQVTEAISKAPIILRQILPAYAKT